MPKHKIIASAPAKLILHGEQTVVLGRTAIATALDLRTFAILEPAVSNVEINLPDLKTSRSWALSDLHFTGELPNEPALSSELSAFIERLAPEDRGLQAFLFLLVGIAGTKLSACSVTVHSEFQAGVGMGSSAAYNVSLAAALLEFFHSVPTTVAPTRNWARSCRPNMPTCDTINKWAFQAEKIMHGTPSGIDNSTSVFGGAISLKKGQIGIVEDVPKLHLVVTNTKVSRSTKALVAKVVDLHKRHPQVIDPLLDCVESICVSVLKLFASRAAGQCTQPELESSIEEFIDINQNVLVALGVGHPSLRRIVEVGARFNLHSKLTGAGGGGCAFTLVPSSTESSVVSALCADLAAEGFDAFTASTGAVGVLLHDPSESLSQVTNL